MRFRLLVPLLSSAVAGVVPAGAQTAASVQYPGGYAPGSSPCVRQADGSCVAVSAAMPLPTAAKQESVALVSANVAASAQAVYGGSYVLTQGCASYGTVTLRYRGPDGATMTAMLTRTAADSGGGTLVQLGSGAIVDATVAGTTGCNVQLARLP